MQYIEQSYKDLQLTLSTSINLDDFTILKSKTLQIKNIEISLYIIGESHIIHYKKNNNSFYEVFACKTLNSDDLFFSKSINELKLKPLSLQKKKYDFEVIIQDELQNVNIDNYDEYIEFIFPKKSITSIGVRMDENDIIIETLHSYLNEKKYIYTFQKLKIKGENGV